MPLSNEEVRDQADAMISALDSSLAEDGFLGKIRRYLKGDHDLPYMPKGAKAEFREIAERSITNWLPLVADTFSKGLFVDGYRAAKKSDNAAAWSYWQANGLDARQSIAHRGALEYGAGYVLVLPGAVKEKPVIRPLNPTRVWALYEDDDAEFPEYALISKGKGVDGKTRIYEFLTDTHVYTLTRNPEKSDALSIKAVEKHGLGVVPIVRFRDRLDGENVGIIHPLFQIQNRINEAVFALMIALQYASFRQRWATGLAIPTKPVLDADGNETGEYEPVDTFEAAVNRLWVSDSSDAKFGDFAQTEVSGHLRTYEDTVRTLAAIAQTPPHVLLGDLVNLSAEALAAAESSTQRKIEEYETIFGESWELVFRLAARAAGKPDSASDEDEVRWRDSETRSFAAQVDALGKIAQMLGVPVTELWERIPGVTDGDVRRWKAAAQSGDGMAMLAAALDRQRAPATGPDPEGDAPPEGGASGSDG